MSFSSSKLFDDDEEDLSGSSRKTNLGNIFGATAQPTQKDSSLSYQRPKAAAKPDAATAKTAAKSGLPSVLHTTRVELYKQGTSPAEYTAVGAAIVENTTGPSKFNLILYYSREKLIAMVPVTRDFVFTLQTQETSTFGTFYDANQKDWTFRFLKVEDAEALAVHVLIAKHYEEPGQILLQDLVAGTKSGAVKDDILGVRYTTYTQKLGKLSDVVDENTSKPQPAKYVVGGANKAGFPGWEVALDGMKRGGKRVLLVPMENGDGATIYKLFLEKMKRANPEPAPGSGKLDLPPVGEHAEAPGSPTSENSILQRMSKMAVPTPFAGATIGSKAAPEPEEPPVPVTQAVPVTPVVAAAAPVAQPAPVQPQQPQPTPQTYPNQAYPGQNNAFGPQVGPYGMQQGPYGQGYGGYGGSQFGNMPPGQYGGLYANQNALSLYNPQQQQPNPWEHLGPWAAAHGVPLGPPQATSTPSKAPPAAAVSTEAASSPAPSKDILSQTEAIQLLIDGRQFQSEIKTTLTKMTSQLEDVEERLEGTMFTKQKDLGGGVTAKVLLQTIARIVSENERMLADLSTRDERIEQLTLQMNKLHETNQRVIDENNRFMVERTSNFKTATDSQLRQLEQFREEKTALEMELTSANRQFQTLKRSFTNVSQELETLKEETERLKTDRDLAVSKYAGVAGASQSAEAKLIDEQSSRRKLELDVQQLRDELAIERESVETLRREAEDRKTRVAREVANAEAHHLAEKAELQDQITKLQELLRKERATLGANAEQAQAEIENKWTARFKADVQRVQSTLEAEWEAKFEEHRKAIEGEARERVKALKEQAVQATATLTAEHEAERATWRERETTYRSTISQLRDQALDNTEAQAVIAQLRSELADAGANTNASIKGIMNQVFVSLNELFEEGDEIQYDKAGIMHTLKRTIVVTTKKLTNPDEAQAEVERPTPVAPILVEVPVRVEVPVEVRVEVPVPVAQTHHVAHVEHNSAPAEIAHHVEERVEAVHLIEAEPLARVDSEVSVNTTLKDPLSTDDDIDPLSATIEAAPEPVEPPQPVGDGWNALPEDEPDFVPPPVELVVESTPEEPTTASPAADADPLSSSATEDDDPPSSSQPLSNSHSASEVANPLSASSASHVEEDPLAAPAPEAAQAKTSLDEIFDASASTPSPSHQKKKSMFGDDDDDDLSFGFNSSAKPKKSSLDDVFGASSDPLAPVDTTPEPVSNGTSSHNHVEDSHEHVEASPLGQAIKDAVIEVAADETSAAEESDVKAALETAPLGAAVVAAITAAAAEPSAEDDDDPFGVNDTKKAVEASPLGASIAAAITAAAQDDDDDDPFGVNEPKTEPVPVVVDTKPAPEPVPEPEQETKQEPVPEPEQETKQEPVPEKPATPNFFLDEQPKTNGTSTPKRTSSFFDDDDDEDEAPKKPVTAPATEPKKKAASSFFGDDEEVPVVKKAPASTSKASLSSVFGDDDDSFGATKSSVKKSDSALDDIFGGISSKGASKPSKGLFDD